MTNQCLGSKMNFYIWDMTLIAETPRLIIREFLPDELETYLEHFKDERVLLYIPKRGHDERVTIFNNAIKQYAISKTLGIWGIYNKVTGEFMGSCLLRPFTDEPGIVELGYSFDQKHWGQGFATEMAAAMIAHSFTDPATIEVVAVTDLANVGSQRVLAKAGLKQVENLRRNEEELAYFRSGR